jgi:uncharacterized membrane protein
MSIRIRPAIGVNPNRAAPAQGNAEARIWLRYVLASAIVLGILFRLYHLDRKTFWEDEIVGTIRTLEYEAWLRIMLASNGLTRG